MSEYLPLEIGLIGAPGSGKTALIEQFFKTSAEWFSERDLVMHAVDDAQTFTTVTDYPLGANSDHFVSSYYHFFRRAAVDEIKKVQDSVIVAGTIFDTLAHLNVRMMNLQKMVLTPQLEAVIQKEGAAAQYLGIVEIQDNRYQPSFLFYCPLPPQIIVAGQNNSFNQEVDAMLQHMFVQLGITVPTLNDPSLEQKAEHMLVHINDNYVGKMEDAADTEEAGPSSV